MNTRCRTVTQIADKAIKEMSFQILVRGIKKRFERLREYNSERLPSRAYLAVNTLPIYLAGHGSCETEKAQRC